LQVIHIIRDLVEGCKPDGLLCAGLGNPVLHLSPRPVRNGRTISMEKPPAAYGAKSQYLLRKGLLLIVATEESTMRKTVPSLSGPANIIAV
jgi:hypothetical protein